MRERQVRDVASRLAALARDASEIPGGHELAQLADPAAAARDVRFQSSLVELAPVPVRGSVVLDAGCGHGEVALVLALLGARRVLAVDVGEEEVATVGRLRDALGDVGARLDPLRASVFDLPVPGASVDLVLSNEAIGVYRDVGAFLDECARVLRPGGAVVMAEGNDVANPRLAARARRLWRAYELGPPGVHDGHVIADPFADQRERLAAELLPQTPPATVREIAERTSRHDRAALAAACARFAETGDLPDVPFDPEEPPIDLDGLFVEAPVDPAWMRAAMAERGLRPRVTGYWGGADGRRAVRAADRLLRPLTPLALRTARGIRYVGVRR